MQHESPRPHLTLVPPASSTRTITEIHTAVAALAETFVAEM